MAKTIRGLAKVLKLCKQMKTALAEYGENIIGAAPSLDTFAVEEAVMMISQGCTTLRGVDYEDEINNPEPPSA